LSCLVIRFISGWSQQWIVSVLGFHLCDFFNRSSYLLVKILLTVTKDWCFIFFFIVWCSIFTWKLFWIGCSGHDAKHLRLSFFPDQYHCFSEFFFVLFDLRTYFRENFDFGSLPDFKFLHCKPVLNLLNPDISFFKTWT
jgi:hypothetical protein